MERCNLPNLDGERAVAHFSFLDFIFDLFSVYFTVLAAPQRGA
jgi:hypothetical protein